MWAYRSEVLMIVAPLLNGEPSTDEEPRIKTKESCRAVHLLGYRPTHLVLF